MRIGISVDPRNKGIWNGDSELDVPDTVIDLYYKIIEAAIDIAVNNNNYNNMDVRCKLALLALTTEICRNDLIIDQTYIDAGYGIPEIITGLKSSFDINGYLEVRDEHHIKFGHCSSGREFEFPSIEMAFLSFINESGISNL